MQIYSDEDTLPSYISAAERSRRLRAASGGAYAVYALIDAIEAGEHVCPSEQDGVVWALRFAARLIERAHDMWTDGPRPIDPRVDGAWVLIGGGRSAIAIGANGEIAAVRGDIPAEEWARHWRRLALVSSVRPHEYRLSLPAIADLMDTSPDGDGVDLRDVRSGWVNLDPDGALSPSCRVVVEVISGADADAGADEDGEPRGRVRLPSHSLSAGQHAALSSALDRAQKSAWDEHDRQELARARRELAAQARWSGLRAADVCECVIKADAAQVQVVS